MATQASFALDARVTALDALRARADSLLSRRRSVPPPDYHELIRDVVVIASSPRSGSSLFAELLRQRVLGQLHLQGEMVPQLALAGLRFPDAGSGSDALDGSVPTATLEYLRALLGAEIGVPVEALDAAAFEDYVVNLAMRLTLQWPLETFGLDEVRAAAAGTLRDLRGRPGSTTDRIVDPELFQAAFLRRVSAAHPAVDPYYYDLPAALIARTWPRRPVPSGPPGDVLVEMPPFVLVEPRRAASREEFASSTFVLKTTSNVYRLGLVAQLFPNATIRVLHLTRNPAACINGLLDGWRHRGFFAFPVGELDIAGYTDEFPAWGGSWWNFDLPPGWEAVSRRPLPEVCGFQWRAAQERILRHVVETAPDYLRVKFEDVVDGLAPGGGVPADVLGWLGGELRPGAGGRIAPVMATQPPRCGRWRDRKALIWPVVRGEAMLGLARELGYGGDPQAWT